MYVIYALIDPRDKRVRYVGVTDDVYKRFLDHINCMGSNFAKNTWIMELRASNKMVIMESLEEVENKSQALMREWYWIQHFQSLEEPILNMNKTTSAKRAKKVNLLEGKQISRELVNLLAKEVAPMLPSKDIVYHDRPILPEKVAVEVPAFVVLLRHAGKQIKDGASFMDAIESVRNLPAESIMLDSFEQELREIGKRLRAGEDQASIVKSYGLPYGRATQELSAVVNMMAAQIEEERARG